MQILEAEHGSFLQLWAPQCFGILTATIFLHAGARTGEEHAYARDNKGFQKCYLDVKAFVSEYKSAYEAIKFLYGKIKLALREDGWLPESDAPQVEEPEKKVIADPSALKL